MSVKKSFRFSEFNNAILEILSERTGKTQTDILEDFIFSHVVYDFEAVESTEIIKQAKERVDKAAERNE